MTARVALVAGATGHVGRHCVDLLLNDDAYSTVIALVRRPLMLAHPKLSQIVVDFSTLDSVADQVRADDLFICLGTTNAATPDREQYYKVDVQYPVDIATIAKRNGARTLCLVSSVGASVSSGQWYLRFKGEVENRIAQIGYLSTAIFRPSLIDGRVENARLKEKLALAVIRFCSFLFIGKSRRFLPLSGELIARAMIATAKNARPGVTTLDRLDMLDLLGLPR